MWHTADREVTPMTRDRPATSRRHDRPRESDAEVVEPENSTVDDWLGQQVARDEDVNAAVADVLRVMRDDPPAIFLAFPREARALDRSFEVPYETDRDIFGTFWRLKRVRPTQDASR